MIVEDLSIDGKKSYRYQPPSKEEKLHYFLNFVCIFEEYAEAAGIDMDSIEFDFKLMNEVNIRVDKRKDYYMIFHETSLNEVREAALTAFWILKFKPFLITNPSGEHCELNVNCGFAAYVILSAAREYIARKYDGNMTFSIEDEEYLKRFRYSLKYWDLSKEALMMLAETLCEKTVHKEGGEK